MTKYLYILIFLMPTYVLGNETHILFDQDQIVPNYYVDKYSKFMVNGKEVQPGDHLVLESGDWIIFQGFLGSENHTLTIKDDKGYAVRLTQHPRDKTR